MKHGFPEKIELDSNALNKYQSESLRWTVRYGVDNVRFWHDLFRSLRLNKNDIKGFEDLKKIPLVYNRTMREHQNLEKGNLHLAAISPNDAFMVCMVCGTHADPIIILKSYDDRYVWKHKNVPRAYVTAGLKGGKKVGNFFPYVDVQIHIGGKLYTMKSVSGPCIEDGLVQLGCTPIAKTNLSSDSASIGTGFTSHIDRFAKRFEEKGFDPKDLGFKRLIMTGDPFLERRKYLADLFGVNDTVEYYADAQFIVKASECEEEKFGGMHVSPDRHIEFTDPKTGEFLADGEEGLVTITDLIPPGRQGGTVSINVVIEDRAKKLSQEKCSCGRILGKISYPKAIRPTIGAVGLEPEYFKRRLQRWDIAGHADFIDMYTEFDEGERQEILIFKLRKKKEFPKNYEELLKSYILGVDPFLKEAFARGIGKLKFVFED